MKGEEKKALRKDGPEESSNVRCVCVRNEKKARIKKRVNIFLCFFARNKCVGGNPQTETRRKKNQ